MKKRINFIVPALLVIFALSACSISFNASESDEDAKIKELEQKLEEVQTPEDPSVSRPNEVETITVTPTPVATAIPTPAITPTPVATAPTPAITPTPPASAVYSGPSYITLNSPKDQQDFFTEPIAFNGVVSPNTTKIVVTAKMSFYDNGDPKGEDVYRLQSFNYGDSTFKYSAKHSYGNLASGSNKYTFTAYFDNSTTKSTTVTVFYTDPSMAEMGKPVIYLYPEKAEDVFVNVAPENGVSVSIPELNNGWNVTAYPDGTIVNKADNEVYPYLFWEGFAANFSTPEKGFVVAKESVSNFFDEKLSYMGLNSTEIADFKDFWVPRLAEKPYYFITFVPQNEFDQYAPLTVVPSPDTVIRVFFDYKGLDSKIDVTPQVLKKGERKGFTLIEWGGRLY